MTNYLDKDGLKKFWEITKGKYSVQGHNHDDRYLKIGATAANADKLGGYASSSYVKTIVIGSKTDYQDTVILLWKDDKTKYYVSHVYGKFLTSNYGSFRYQCADIDLWFSRWTSTDYDCYFGVNSYGIGSRVRLVTCTYNGETWWAIQHTSIQSVVFSFVGYYTNNVSWKPIIYYNQNTKQVLNQEIYDSIVDQSSKLSTFYVGYSRNALMNDIPTNLSQLSDDVVKGKYLPLTGGTLTGGLTTNGTFHSVGASTLDSTLTVGGAATLNSSLTVKGATTVQGSIKANGSVDAKSISIKGDTFDNAYEHIEIQAEDTNMPSILAAIKDTSGNYLSGVGISSGGLIVTLNDNGYSTDYNGTQFNIYKNVDDDSELKGSITFPEKTGTIALDVDLAQYLPLSGGTISGNLTVNGVLTTKGNGLELYHATPFIDFHYGNSAADYDVRIRNNVSGGIQIEAPKLIDLVGPMKSSGGRLWITNGNTNIYDVTTSQLTSYVKAKHLLTSWFVGNVGIGTDADAAYKLKVNGKAYFGQQATFASGIKVSGGIIDNGNFYTDEDGRVYTTQLNISDGGDIVMRDSNGDEHILNLQKAIELGVFS